MRTCNFFGKSEHFLLRQWERGFSDSIVERIVSFIPQLKKGRNVYIVSVNTLKQCGIEKTKRCVALVMNGFLAISIYYIEDNVEFFSKNQHNTQFQII